VYENSKAVLSGLKNYIYNFNLRNMMKKKEKSKEDFQIPEEALRKIKSQAELDDFSHGLYKQAVEGMLKAEMDEHLG
jgi:hypothetical protein